VRQGAAGRGGRQRLRGLWTTMTGQAQMLAGAQRADPELFFSGVVTAL
jgi:hypothetical protein